MSTIRILIVDDHEMVRRSIATLLSTESSFDVVGHACTGLEAVRRAEQHQPDVVLLDISLPELNGLQAAPLIKRVAPATEILMVTNHDNPFLVREALRLGARGFVSKSEMFAELITAIVHVHAKKRFISKALSTAVGQVTAAPSPTAG